MKDEELLKRITVDAKIMVGKPVIRGTRLTVDFILNLLAHGATEKEILEEYQGPHCRRYTCMLCLRHQDVACRAQGNFLERCGSLCSPHPTGAEENGLERAAVAPAERKKTRGRKPQGFT